MMLSILVCVASIIVIPIAHGSEPLPRRVKKACETEECKNQAQIILNSVDTTVDPCDDFYAYACGSWQVNNPIPDYRAQWSAFSQMTERTNERLRDIISEAEDPNSPLFVKNVQRFYKSCMDTERLETQGIERLTNILNQNGGWPIAMPKERWNPSVQSWLDLMDYYFKLTGDLAIIKVMYSFDDEDPTKLVSTINHYRNYPFRESNNLLHTQSGRDNYTSIITQTAAIFAGGNENVSREQILNDAADMLLLEHHLRNITSAEYDSEEVKMSIGEFQEMYDNFGNRSQTNQIDWLQLMSRVLNDVKHITITRDTQIYVSCQSCFSDLAKVIYETDQRTLVNYIHWVFLSNHMKYTNKQMRDIRHQMLNNINEFVAEKPRWEDCIEEHPLKDGMSIMFVQKYVGPSAITNTKDMSNTIRDLLKRDVEQVEWANDELKQYIRDKLDNLRENIGYPEWYKNETAVQILYENLEFGPDYLENVFRYVKYEMAQHMQSMSTGVTKYEWMKPPISAGAFHIDSLNMIIIPAALIQEPYFVEKMPNAVNYGSIGSIAGLLIGRGLDTLGISFNKDGVRLQNNLQGMLDIYNDRAQCFVRQYNNFTLDDFDEDGKPKYMDGNWGIRQSIPQTLSILAAYEAFKLKQESDTTTPLTLKDLPNTNADQLFFLSYATEWCYAERKGIKSYLRPSVPPNIRVNGALMNSEDFAKTFQCPNSSKMNPASKCSLWK